MFREIMLPQIRNIFTRIKSLKLKIQLYLIITKNKFNKELIKLVSFKRKYLISSSQNELDCANHEILMNITGYKKQIEQNFRKTSKRIVVFSGIVNNCNFLKFPSFINEDYDYICFAEAPIANASIWQIKPYLYLSSNPLLTIGYIKTHLHTLFKGYDSAVWIDQDYMIVGNLDEKINCVLKNDYIGGAFGYQSKIASLSNRELSRILRKLTLFNSFFYSSSVKRPEKKSSVKIDTNFIVFNLKHPMLEAFLNIWWRKLIKNLGHEKSAFNLSLSKIGYKYFKLFDFSNLSMSLLKTERTKCDSCSLVTKSFSPYIVNPYFGKSFFSVRNERLSEVSTKTINIVICVHNALDDFKKCINSVIKTRTENNNYKISIINDASNNSTSEYINRIASKYRFISVSEVNDNINSLGYTKSANFGLRNSHEDFTILLNSDTIVVGAWAKKLIYSIVSSPGSGISGPLSNAAGLQSIPSIISSVSGQSVINSIPKKLSLSEIDTLCEEWTLDLLFPKVPLIHGFCFCVSKETIKKIGFFDELNFSKGYGEEEDYCFRALDKGIDLVVATNTFVFHAKSKSYKSSRRRKLMRKAFANLCLIYGYKRLKLRDEDISKNAILETFRKKSKLVFEHLK